MRAKKFTVYDLKYYYQSNNNGHFFDRKTMQFFNDKMSNFGLRGPMEVTDMHGEVHQVYELYRRKGRVFMGCNVGTGKTSYFDAVTYKQIHSID